MLLWSAVPTLSLPLPGGVAWELALPAAADGRQRWVLSLCFSRSGRRLAATVGPSHGGGAVFVWDLAGLVGKGTKVASHGRGSHSFL